jgi:hypothetical protein
VADNSLEKTPLPVITAVTRPDPLAKTSAHDHGRDAVVPGVASAAEGNVTEVANAASKLPAAAFEITIVKDRHTASAEYLNGGDVVSEIPRKPAQAVASTYTKMVAPETGVSKETGSNRRERAPIPGAVPVRVISVVPIIAILRAHQDGGERAAEE